MSLRALHDPFHFDCELKADVTSIQHAMDMLLAHMHTQTPTHTHTDTHTLTKTCTPTQSLFCVHTAQDAMNLCISYTLVLTLVALSKKLKDRSGWPTMYIKDRLRKKDHTALPTSTVSLIGVACVLVKGVMFMGHCILVQLAQHSHRSGGCFSAVALLSRGVRDRATGTA